MAHAVERERAAVKSCGIVDEKGISKLYDMSRSFCNIVFIFYKP